MIQQDREAILWVLRLCKYICVDLQAVLQEARLIEWPKPQQVCSSGVDSCSSCALSTCDFHAVL